MKYIQIDFLAIFQQYIFTLFEICLEMKNIMILNHQIYTN